jgi:chromosomal replication initiator protein
MKKSNEDKNYENVKAFLIARVSDPSQREALPAQAIAKEPGQRFNPLFIYGGVGLGKTHLMQAVANAILESHPEKNVVYTSTQTYINDFLESIRNKATSNFTETYNNADVLVIDDIQFIAGKDKTMEEFFHTFNLLHQNNKQIILSADQPPRSIPTLPDRLRSRFEWGMTVDVQSPDFETRCAIIQSKAKAQDIELDYESVEFVASNIKNNIRELEGAINQILVLCQVQNLKPDLELVKNILKSATKTPKRFTYQHITSVCCDHFGIEESDVLSARRDKEIALTRQIAMYLMRTELKMSLPKIASALGRKDHTTAIHSINKIAGNLDEDFNLRRHVGAIRQKLYEQ